MSDRLPEPILFCESLFTPTSYKDLSEVFYSGAPDKPTIVDFTNTHITVLRLTDPEFRRSAAVVGSIVAILYLLLPPLFGLIDQDNPWPVTVASTALSFSAIAFLILLLTGGNLISILGARSHSRNSLG